MLSIASVCTFNELYLAGSRRETHDQLESEKDRGHNVDVLAYVRVL